jgi:hypothetical protein
LLGRRTYDDWAAFWPGSDIEPFASFINPVEKYVFSSTPLETTWTNATVVHGDMIEFVPDLKTNPATTSAWAGPSRWSSHCWRLVSSMNFGSWSRPSSICTAANSSRRDYPPG